MRGAKYCVSHNPDAADLKRLASQKGGRNRRIAKRASKPDRRIQVQSVADVQHLLFQTLAELRNGVVDAEIARTVGYLSGIAVRVAEAVELESRVTQLEDQIEASFASLERLRAS